MGLVSMKYFTIPLELRLVSENNFSEADSYAFS